MEFYKRERNRPKRPCPRECGNNILTGENAVYNARSKVDNRMICSACYVEEAIKAATGD
jgi:hypothetical protein